MVNLKEALNKFKDKNILVMGDIFLDRFSWGEINRTNPEQPAAHLVKVLKESFVLGGAGNVANNIASLGAKCSLYGILGKDSSGNKIKKMCKNKNIFLRSFSNNKPTIVKQRIMAHGQQITRMDFGEKNIKKINPNMRKKLINLLKKEITNFDFIILSDYDKCFFDKEMCSEIINLAKEKNIPTLVDPKPNNIDFFNGCSLICPNKKEAEKITGIKYLNEKGTLMEIAKILSNKINSQYVIITCGEDGMFSYHDGNGDFVETQAQEVVDVTGAGDTFAATMTLSLASGLKIHDAARLANYAAGVVVEKIGTATPKIKEIEKKIEEGKKFKNI